MEYFGAQVYTTYVYIYIYEPQTLYYIATRTLWNGYWGMVCIQRLVQSEEDKKDKASLGVGLGVRGRRV